MLSINASVTPTSHACTLFETDLQPSILDLSSATHGSTAALTQSADPAEMAKYQQKTNAQKQAMTTLMNILSDLRALATQMANSVKVNG